jgi:peptidoglycan-N-acetylglucosamine deacetylase
MRWVLAVGVAAAALSAAPATQAAGAVRSGPEPLLVTSSSLVQNGQQITWRVQMAGPFSPAAVVRAGGTVCLLRERLNQSVAGEACIYGPKGRVTTARIIYMPVTAAGPGPGRRVSATITRPGVRTLSATFAPQDIGTGYVPIRWQVISTLSAPPCTPKPGAARCVSLFPRHPALFKMHVPQVVGCVPAGPSLVFSGPSRIHQLALTFDDGPWNSPPSIDFVNLLARLHVPATFFEIGNQIPEFDASGSIERTMLADGDMIGDHTWTHPDMTKLSPAEQTSQLQLTANAINHATGFSTCIWRPPYGAIDNQLVSLARSLGLLTIYWDVDTVDWSLPGTATIIQRAVSGAHNGAIILQHFGGGPRYETYNAIPSEVATLRREGYQFVTIPQLLGLRMIYR